MSRRTSVPSYRLHRQSGQAVVTLTDGLGIRRDVLLGTHGTHESRVEYARVIAEWEAASRTLPQGTTAADITVNELALAYWQHAERHYRRPDGTPTSEVRDLKLSLKPLKKLYGHTLAKDFGPLALKAVRQAMTDGSWLTDGEKETRQDHGHKTTWSRGVINQRIGRIRRMFKWGVEQEMVGPAVYQALMAVRGLCKGRSDARETAPVKPVSEAVVTATLPFLTKQVGAMVELQLATGMRPGEVAILRGIDLDMTGKVWSYRPGSDLGAEGQHKTSWRGHQRTILIGPRGQELLRPWLRLNLHEYLFQPKESRDAFDAERKANRKSKVTPSQSRRRRKKNPKRAPGDHYTGTSYDRAISRAIENANKARACEPCKALLPEQRCATCKAGAIPHWHPHRLRHTKATEIRKHSGLDAARAVLGHRSPSITETYAEIDIGKASEVMERLG